MNSFREGVWQFRWGRLTFLVCAAGIVIGVVAAILVVQSYLILALVFAGADLALCGLARYLTVPRWTAEAEELERKIRQEEGWWI